MFIFKIDKNCHLPSEAYKREKISERNCKWKAKYKMTEMFREKI